MLRFLCLFFCDCFLPPCYCPSFLCSLWVILIFCYFFDFLILIGSFKLNHGVFCE